MKLEANITLECLQVSHVKYACKIIQKLLKDNGFAMKVTIKLISFYSVSQGHHIMCVNLNKFYFLSGSSKQPQVDNILN